MSKLFTTEMTVASQTREARNVAIREAMIIIINRLTSNKGSIRNSVVETALDNASSYVDQYRYVQEQVEIAKNSLGILQVTFDKESLIAMLNSSGMAFWGENRDKTLVWLIIDQGGRQVFLDVVQNAAIEAALLGAASAKGIPLLMPLMDLEEKQDISVKDIMAPSQDRVLAVSARYDVATILSGKLIKRGRCWRSEWNLHVNNRIERWTEPCADLKTNIMGALQYVYQNLAGFYAVKFE